MPNAPSIDDCKIIGFRIQSDRRGHLIPLEISDDPEKGDTRGMDVNRVFWIFGVPRGAIRGNHAAKHCSQILIALHGSVSIDIEDVYDGWDSAKLDSPHFGLYLPPMIWVTLRDFSEDAVVMALCDRWYMSTGHCRDREEWKGRVECE